MSEQPQTKAVHSMAFIDALEDMLGINLGLAYKVVVTAEIDKSLDIAIYQRGTLQHINGFRVFSDDELRNSVRIVNDDATTG